MTGLERMRCAFRHCPGDRVPVYEQGIARDVASSILGREAYTGLTGLHKIEAEAWLKGPEAAEEFYEKVVQDGVDLARYLDMDAVSLPWLIGTAPSKKVDEFTYIWGDIDSGNYVVRRWDPITDTMGDLESHTSHWGVEDVTRYVLELEQTHSDRPMPKPSDFGYVCRLQELAGEMAVVLASGFAVPLDEVWLEATIVCPDVVEKYLDIQVDWCIDSFKVMREMGIEFVWGGGDMASNHGPIYSPAFFRQYMLPRWKKITQVCRSLGIFYVFRSDGDLWSIADDLFVDAGFDGYGEIDVDAGMELGRLKQKYGHLTFWGNVSCGRVLRMGSRDDVIEATKKVVDDAAYGGGLVGGSSNTILYGTPAENFVAMVETYKSYGRY